MKAIEKRIHGLTVREARRLTLEQIQALPMDVRLELAQREAGGAVILLMLSFVASVVVAVVLL